MKDVVEFTAHGHEFRVVKNVHGPVPHLDYRPAGGGAWRGWAHPAARMLAAYAAEMEARANEYHDTTMKQAKRIAELESRNAVLEEHERVLDAAWRQVQQRIGGIYDDFQGPEDALLQMSKRLCETEPSLGGERPT